MKKERPENDDALLPLRRRHMRFGWWALLAFLSLGIGLELLHALKAGFYLDVPASPRRFLWTLAHAHGTLLSLVNVVFGLSLGTLVAEPRGVRVGSASLVAATLLLPGGFFLGGVVIHGGDPGLGVVLVPLGAAALLVGVLAAARAFGRERT
jgi:hypothetical protein